MKKIAIIIDYFGVWPDWISLFFLSCSKNVSIDWHIHTDCEFEKFNYPNVFFYKIGWDEYKKLIGQRLGIKFNPSVKYKLVDIKPAFGYIWQKQIESYDFYGYGDLDVIYGDLRKFFTEDVLSKVDVFSTHNWCLSGHLCLFKNKCSIRGSFKKHKRWKRIFSSDDIYRFDEDFYYDVFKGSNAEKNRSIKNKLLYILRKLNPFDLIYKKIHLQEQYSTPLVPGLWQGYPRAHSDVWYWSNGVLTNAHNGSIEFMYIHFMNYISARYMDQRYGDQAPWKKQVKYLNFDPDAKISKFRIDLNGIHLME